MTDEAQRLSNLIGDIYDATLDAGLWPSVVERIAKYTSGSFVNLFSQDATRKTAQAFYSYGLTQQYLESYFQKYIHINPMFPAMLFFEVGRILTEDDVMPMSEFIETTFYKEWIKPQGLRTSLASVLEKSATSVAGIAVGFGEHAGRDEARRRLELVVPHVRRAVVIGKVIDLKKVEAAAMADALDEVAAGFFLVDATGRIVHANASGLVMLNEGVAVNGAGGKLVASDAVADRSLHEIFSSTVGGDTALGAKGIAVPLAARDGDRYVAHVLPLNSGVRKKAGIAYSAAAAVFLRKAALELPHPLESLAGAYKLTAAEMRVLMSIIQVGGVPEVAPVLGISETTVKTHLQHIFAKTGTSRQADLVKLVAGYMSPLG
ncbi:MAG: helix-turn-helix transcriptional regulator [Xanthobacteraceae bacterium]|nr:helix-turn-helix transcriptional regulator [Xanthobacteraceae bacterium]